MTDGAARSGRKTLWLSGLDEQVLRALRYRQREGIFLPGYFLSFGEHVDERPFAGRGLQGYLMLVAHRPYRYCLVAAVYQFEGEIFVAAEVEPAVDRISGQCR